MECSLTYENSEKSQRNGVLILILMEYSQTIAKGHIWRTYGSLNPYSNGILTDRQSRNTKKTVYICLNPYSNGILTDMFSLSLVNILQPRLNPYSNGILTDKYFELTIGGTLVLILILMEYSQTNVMKCKLSKELSS